MHVSPSKMTITLIGLCWLFGACSNAGSSGTNSNGRGGFLQGTGTGGSSGGAGLPTACSTDSQCTAAGNVCHDDGFCSPPCLEDSDCPAKYTCPGLKAILAPDCDETGEHTGGLGACDLFDGDYNTASCQALPSVGSCLPGPDAPSKCWYAAWSNGSCTAILKSCLPSGVEADLQDQDSACNAGFGFSGNNRNLDLSTYSYIAVSAWAPTGDVFEVQLTDSAKNYCYWTFTGTDTTSSYLVNLASPSYCGATTINKASITSVDFMTAWTGTGTYELDIYSVTFE